LKTPALLFIVDGKHVVNGEFLKTRTRLDNHVINPNPGKCTRHSRCSDADHSCVFKISPAQVDGKHLMRFRSENSALRLFRDVAGSLWNSITSFHTTCVTQNRASGESLHTARYYPVRPGHQYAIFS